MSLIYRKKWFFVFLKICLLFIFTIGLAYSIRKVMGENTIGADFFIYWQAGRSAFIEGKNPYSDEVTRSIQLGIYGQPARPGQDQVAFAYPAYALAFIYPFVWLDFPDAQAIWMAVFIVIWLVSALSLTNTTSRWAGGTIIFYYPLAFGIILGNFNILVGFAILILLHMMATGQPPGKMKQIAAGICMTVCMVKPQMSWIVLLVSLLLILKFRWWNQLVAFIASSAFLFVYSILRFPGWISLWFEQSRKYNLYIPPEPLPLGFSRVFLPDEMAQIVSLCLLTFGMISLFLITFRWIRSIKTNQFSGSGWLFFGLLGLFTYLVHPWPKSYEQIIILVPFFFWICAFSQMHKSSAILVYFSGLILSWAGLFGKPVGMTPLIIYVWPILFFVSWQIFSWLTYKKAER